MDFRVRGSFLLSSLLVLSGAVACGGSGGSDDLFGDGSAGGAAGDGQGGGSGASAGKGGASAGSGGTSAGAGGTSAGAGGTTAGSGGATGGSGGTSGKGGGAGASGAGGSAGATGGSAGAPGGAAGAGGGGASGKGGAGSGGASGAGTGGAAGKGGTAGGSGTAGAAGIAGNAGTGGATGGAGGSAGAAGGGAAGTAGKGGGAGGQAAVCGDGVKNGTEECDGADLGGKSCTDFAKVGTLVCSQCKLDTSGCSSCGNGNIDAGEECDDGNATADDGCTSCKLDGTTCTSAMPIAINDFGSLKLTGSTKGGGSHDNTVCPAKGPDRIYVVTPGKSGFLTAWISRGAFNGASTNFDTVLIAKSDCAGDAVILCNDSFDDTDPGSPKSLPGGEVVSFPVEAGKSYYLIVDGFGASFSGNYDLDLDLSSGQSCADPVPLVLQPGHAQKVIGRTQGQGADSEATCGGKAAADVVYSVTRAAPGTIALSLDATYDSLLYARGTCATNPPELFCSHTPGNGGETGTIGLAPTPSGATFVWVDGLSGAEGEYTLTLDPLQAVSPEGGRPAHAFEATGRLGSNRLSSSARMGARSPAARALPHVALASGVLAASLAACARAPSGVGARAPVPSGRPAVTSNVTRADHAGSASCQPCHAELYARWEAAAMKRMTRDAAGGAALAFDGRTFRFKDDTVQLEQRDGVRYARITSPKFGSGRYRVTKVIGGRVREDFAGVPVSEDGRPLSSGHDERILPVSHVIATGELRYKGYSVMATERPGMRAAPVWNRTCIFCHNTVPYLSTIYGALAPGSGGYQGTHVDGLLPQARRRPFTITDEPALRGALEDEVAVIKGSREHAPPSTRKALEWAASTSRTRYDERHLVEVGIGCEACHMGSKEHVADPAVLPSFAPRSPFLTVTLGPAEAETRACARCHQVLFSQYPFTWEGERRRGGAPGGSNINSGEARDFLLGGCASAMRCSTCHDPHTKQPARSDDAVCVTCHTRYQGDDAVAAHTHHAPKGEGSRCVGCHLPKKNMSLGGGLTRYHRVGSPTDDARVTADRPLECALCHGDATVESLVSSMERFWGKRYDRQKLAQLYGTLDAKPLLATLAMGKPHEQAVAISLLGDARSRAAVPLLAKHMTHPVPLLRYWARDALVKLVGEPSPVNLHQEAEKIAAETRAWLGRHGHAVDVGTQKAGDGKDDDD